MGCDLLIALLKNMDKNVDTKQEICKTNNEEEKTKIKCVETEENGKGGMLPFLIPALARRIV